LGGREETEAYNDSLKVLKKSYLYTLFMEHSRKANEMMQAGDMAYVEELNEVMRIKNEMDEL
jgi:DNA primase